MRVLVTGGAGFIGSHTCEALLRRGDSVVIVDDLNTFYAPAIKQRNLAAVAAVGKISVHQIDIRDAAALAQVFAAEAPEAVIHLAARAGVRPSLDAPVLYEEVNVIGTLHLLELCRKHAVRNFVFASSSSVYGINSKVPFSETDPIAFPVSPYATTKRSGELVCFNYAHLYGIPISCLRFFTVYGPRQRPEMAIYKFTAKIFAGEPIDVYGDGTSSRDYTYIDDIVAGVLAALDRPVPYEIYNLGGSDPITLHRLISVIESAVGKPAQRNRLPDQPGDVPTTFADISKAGQMLGYLPATPIEVGIGKFRAWYQATVLRT